MPKTGMAGAPGRRSNAERRDESERLLVEATLNVVTAEGVGAATFDAVGKAAGYSRGLPAQKFGSKQGMIEAVIAHLHREREAVLEADHTSEMPGLDAILHYVDTFFEGLREGPAGPSYFMLLASAVADPTPLRKVFAASHERVGEWLEAQIRRGQEQGNIRAEFDAPSTAHMIGSLMIGLCMQWLVDDRGRDLEPVRVTYLAALRQSLATHPA